MPTPYTRRRTFLLALGVAGLASGCGFRLRGPQPLIYSTMYVNVSQHSSLGAELRRRIRTSGTTTTVEDVAEADARLEIVRNSREREILSLSGGGSVREYELTRHITFRVVDSNGEDAIPPTTLRARRDFTFDDEQVIAKQREEDLLYEHMETDLIDQIMRRLAALEA